MGIGLQATGWRRLFAYILFINSSCRGPFLPPYAARLHWTEPFTSKITEQVKLVGPSIHFIPGAAAHRNSFDCVHCWPSYEQELDLLGVTYE